MNSNPVKWFATVSITLGLCWACWLAWNKVPTYVRMLDRDYLGRVGITDFSYLASLLLVFLALSLLNPVLQWAWSKLFGQSAFTDDDESSQG